MERLSELGYHFNEKGELRRSKDGKGFQARDEEEQTKVTEAIQLRIFEILQEEFKCQRIFLPLSFSLSSPPTPLPNAPASFPFTFIFLSPDAFVNDQDLLLIIQGSGAVRFPSLPFPSLPFPSLLLTLF